MLLDNMNIKQKQELLAGLFTIVTKTDGKEYICFKSEYMDESNADKYAIYKIISNAQRESGLSFNFSYDIGEKAAGIVAELEDLDDEDAITEAIDQAIPIYTDEIMSIYTRDSAAVDEAAEELGGDDSNSRAVSGWYNEIRKMVYTIISELKQ
jgi:hypothetical protein